MQRKRRHVKPTVAQRAIAAAITVSPAAQWFVR
jgi:hypothetical protein